MKEDCKKCKAMKDIAMMNIRTKRKIRQLRAIIWVVCLALFTVVVFGSCAYTNLSRSYRNCEACECTSTKG